MTLFFDFLKENHLLIITVSLTLLIILTNEFNNLISENEILILKNQSLLETNASLNVKIKLLENRVYNLENPDDTGILKSILNYLFVDGKNLTTYFKKW